MSVAPTNPKIGSFDLRHLPLYHIAASIARRRKAAPVKVQAQRPTEANRPLNWWHRLYVQEGGDRRDDWTFAWYACQNLVALGEMPEGCEHEVIEDASRNMEQAINPTPATATDGLAGVRRLDGPLEEIEGRPNGDDNEQCRADRGNQETGDPYRLEVRGGDRDDLFGV